MAKKDDPIPPIPVPSQPVMSLAVPPVEAPPAVPAAPAVAAGDALAAPLLAPSAGETPVHPVVPTYAPASLAPVYPAPVYSAPPAYAAPPAGPAQGLSIASMVCGIAGIVLSFFWIGFLPALAAVITGHLAQKRQPLAKPFWLTGIITGYVGMAIGIVATILVFAWFVLILGMGTLR